MSGFIYFLPFYPTGLNCSHVFTLLTRNPPHVCRCNFCDDLYHSTSKECQTFDYFSLLPLALVILFAGVLEDISSPDRLCAWPRVWRRPYLPLGTPRLESYQCLLAFQG